MLKKNALSLIAFAAITTGVDLTAQDRTHPDDANRDGVISRREWRGDGRSFRDLDRNEDGVLSGSEVPGGTRSDRSRDRDYGDRNASQSRSRAGALDKDRSGAVEGYEWPYNPDVFHQLDRDGNSELSPDELRNVDSARLRRPEGNRSGRTDSNDWDGRFADFDRLDDNRDGRVSAEEYYQRGGESRQKQRFDAMDSNRDGIIQSTEWKGDAKLFHSLDTDGDSRVSWSEFGSDRYRRSR